MLSSASSFFFKHPLFSLRSSSSCLRLFPRLPVTSVLPLIMCFRKQFLCKISPIQLDFRLFIVCSIFLPLLDSVSYFISRTIGSSFSSTTFQNFQGILIYSPKCPKSQHHMLLMIQYYGPNIYFYVPCGLLFPHTASKQRCTNPARVNSVIRRRSGAWNFEVTPRL